MEGRRFPIMSKHLKSIPWEMIAPCEPRALRNHDQSLAVLARRGGLSPDEALMVLDDRSWKGRVFFLPRDREDRDAQDAERAAELMSRVAAWETGS